MVIMKKFKKYSAEDKILSLQKTVFFLAFFVLIGQSLNENIFIGQVKGTVIGSWIILITFGLLCLSGIFFMLEFSAITYFVTEDYNERLKHYKSRFIQHLNKAMSWLLDEIDNHPRSPTFAVIFIVLILIWYLRGLEYTLIGLLFSIVGICLDRVIKKRE
jgi:hypothetical protein